MRKKVLIVIGILLTGWACHTPEEIPDPSRLGYDFFPLEFGQYAVYNVFRVEYRVGARPDTQRFQLKERVADTLTDLRNERAFVVHRFSRTNSGQRWRLDSVWVAKRTPYQAIRKENNVDFVKLSFPIKENLSWNGNVFNNFGQEPYRAEAFDQPFAAPDTIYPRTVRVVQRRDSSGTALDRRQEVYARRTGLIYKERIQIRYEQQNGTIGSGRPESGIYYILRIKDFGVEK